MLDEKTESFAETVKRLEEEGERRLIEQSDKLTAEWQDERRALITRYRHEIKRRMEQLRDDLRRRWKRDLRLNVDEERVGRLGQLERIQSELKQLERIFKDNAIVIDRCAANSQLQVAAGALRRAVDASQRTAFADELAVLRQVAHHFPMLEPVVASIDEETAYRGVETTLELVDRFVAVKEQVRRTSMVPEDGGLISHAVSATMSTLLVRKEGYAAGSDVEAVLARTEYLLRQNDLDNAARELNQLTGWPKSLARDWIQAARQRLEILQALEVVEAQSYLAALQLS
ncbi:mitochondrial inner membrane protein Mitofilin [Thamnocephalis sphaerospora]|uniref:MICOS complex subunit MIC60 n=1 Tax=Thamnocephalis sphaerospora TaxID=78915 RepID=A0A4V1IW10_9FUNG|nr:mitochondrial inner membrane protein Mitofilin [Thamnocephalis sphaerospora]|eukprot:RKP05929.1 mitochondrial inner membrane protein Mitofilin [Thamnocephalis sphaerospora]